MSLELIKLFSRQEEEEEEEETKKKRIESNSIALCNFFVVFVFVVNSYMLLLYISISIIRVIVKCRVALKYLSCS